MKESSSFDDMDINAIDQVRKPLGEAFTLPQSAYTDETIYREELARVLRRSWIPVARIDQISDKGSFLTLDLLGQPVMVVHGNDDEIRVMSSVCLHRAAPVAEG